MNLVGCPSSLPASWECLGNCLLGPTADIEDATLDGLDLSGLDLSDAHAEDTSFDNANLSGASLTNADVQDTEFGGANLTNTDLTGDPRGMPLVITLRHLALRRRSHCRHC